MAFLKKDDTYEKIDEDTVIVTGVKSTTLRKANLESDRLRFVQLQTHSTEQIAEIDEQLALWKTPKGIEDV